MRLLYVVACHLLEGARRAAEFLPVMRENQNILRGLGWARGFVAQVQERERHLREPPQRGWR